MNNAYKFSARLLMSLMVATWSLSFRSSCRAAEQTPDNLAERLRVLRAEDLGSAPIAQSSRFSSHIFAEAASSGLAVMSTSKVTSRTNQFFAELRQNLALEATEPQLLNFLGNLAASNSTLRVQSLSLRPTPDRSRLQANMAITGVYRVPSAAQSSEPDASQTEYLVLTQRRQLRQAALDCYNVTKSTLPPGWKLDNLSFEDGKRLSVQGQAPADQVAMLPEVQTRFEKSQAEDGKALFLPSSGGPTMRMAPGLTNFSWSVEFELRPLESH